MAHRIPAPKKTQSFPLIAPFKYAFVRISENGLDDKPTVIYILDKITFPDYVSKIEYDVLGNSQDPIYYFNVQDKMVIFVITAIDSRQYVILAEDCDLKFEDNKFFGWEINTFRKAVDNLSLQTRFSLVPTSPIVMCGIMYPMIGGQPDFPLINPTLHSPDIRRNIRTTMQAVNAKYRQQRLTKLSSSILGKPITVPGLFIARCASAMNLSYELIIMKVHELNNSQKIKLINYASKKPLQLDKIAELLDLEYKS
ncbi:hypothetical protein TRFO_43275 [Tritrichomonas foetus]|uniref:Uncharacterized protein n=1 Tax=Tritrichomonas foetus TaxID=1144522 RepID=A0A1J4KR80_9EUKA|nr:hypothetical protein TRFO_43275 [Tritrichomonas foetus]|eukprot:OHT13755.1 hypothetical protein TRFO_43275 [Tritrichomonas foetus]